VFGATSVACPQQAFTPLQLFSPIWPVDFAQADWPLQLLSPIWSVTFQHAKNLLHEPTPTLPDVSLHALIPRQLPALISPVVDSSHAAFVVGDLGTQESKLGMEDLVGINEGKLLGSEDSVGINEGKLLGSEDSVGINEGKLLGSEDSVGINEGKLLGSEETLPALDASVLFGDLLPLAFEDFELVIKLKLSAMLFLLTTEAPSPAPDNTRIAAMRRILLRLLLTMLPAWLEERYSSASWPKGSSVTSFSSRPSPSSFEVFLVTATISTLGALKSLVLTVMMIGRRVGEFVMISVEATM